MNTIEDLPRVPGKTACPCVALLASSIEPRGFSDDESLLPYGVRSFQGFRLFQEYFAMPERFLFVRLTGLGSALGMCSAGELDLIFLFRNGLTQLEDAVNASNFALFCTPAVNLFERRADRIHLAVREPEFHIVPDRTRPRDFDVYSVTEVLGFAEGPEPEIELKPFYQSRHSENGQEREAYYTLFREFRRPLHRRERKQRRMGSTHYEGSELYIAIADSDEPPYPDTLKQLGVKVPCTNGNQPLRMRAGAGRTDFILQSNDPVRSVRCLHGPTRPGASHVHDGLASRLVAHLSINYHSLIGGGKGGGPAALRRLLALYANLDDPAALKQIEGVISVSQKPIAVRLWSPGPIVFGRGIEVTVTLDDQAFDGYGPFLFGTVLQRFLDRYREINSLIETVIKTPERGEIGRWKPRTPKPQTRV